MNKKLGEDLNKLTTVIQQEALIDWSDLLCAFSLKRDKVLYIKMCAGPLDILF